MFERVKVVITSGQYPNEQKRIERVIRAEEMAQYGHLVTRAGWCIVSVEWTEEAETE